MQSEPEISIEDIRVELMKRGLPNVQALAIAQQKFVDLTNGIDLPYERYLSTEPNQVSISR